jgi:hypothetical protein
MQPPLPSAQGEPLEGHIDIAEHHVFVPLSIENGAPPLATFLLLLSHGAAEKKRLNLESPRAVPRLVAGAGAFQPAAWQEVECCVCLETGKSHIFLPCGHFCA